MDSLLVVTVVCKGLPVQGCCPCVITKGECLVVEDFRFAIENSAIDSQSG